MYWFLPVCKLFVIFLLDFLSFRNIFSNGSPDNKVYVCFVPPLWFSDLCLWKIGLLVGRHLEIGMPISCPCLRRYRGDVWGSVRLIVALMVGRKKVLVTIALSFYFDITYSVCCSTDLCSACYCVHFLCWICTCLEFLKVPEVWGLRSFVYIVGHWCTALLNLGSLWHEWFGKVSHIMFM